MRKSLFGGYPHEGIKSLEVYPNRIPTSIVDEKVSAFIDAKYYPQYTGVETAEEMKDFLLDRLHDVNTALGIAEQQIRDIQHEYPFIPQDFNFEETEIKFPGEGFVPTCYKKGPHLLARVVDAEHDWFLSGLGKITIPNAQIAYIVLRSLGVISDEEFAKDVEIKAIEEATAVAPDMTTSTDALAPEKGAGEA